MMNLKIAFDSLSRKLTFTILAILQMAITFTFLYNFIYINEESKNLEEKFNNSFKENMYVIEPFIDMDDIISEENLRDKKLYLFHDYLKKTEDLKSLSSNEGYILTKEFEGYEDFLYTNNYAPNFNGIQTRAINALEIDYGYIKNFDIKVSTGEILKEEDFKIKNDRYPILLGKDFENVFKIGEEIDGFGYYGEKIIYEVKGFVQNGYYDVGLPLNEYNIKSLDKIILVPFKYKSFDAKSTVIETFMQINKSIITLNNSEDKNRVIEEANKNFGKIKLTKLDDVLANYKEGIKLERTIISMIFLLVMIVCGVGIITNIMNSIKLKYKTFGVHLLSGASKKDIIKSIILEIIIIFILAGILSITGIIFLSESGFVTLKIYYLIKLSVYITIVGLLILIYPLIKLRKLSINKLLKGE
ncbi:MAG: FtsX-like permease family protein [Clostridium sp.]